MTLLVLLAIPTLYNTPLDGPSAETGTARERSLDGRPRVEEILSGTPDADSFGQHLRYLTAEPHRAGTPRNMKLADYVRDRFREFGLDEVRFHDTPALLSSPVASSVELVAPIHRRLKLREDPIPEDPDSDLYDDPSQIPYHAYAASGDVTAERFESDLAGRASLSDSLSQDRIRKVNTLLLQISRSMTEKKGLQGRTFFKHLIYAPQPTYRPEVIPRIFEAIERREPESIPRHEAELVAAFERAAELLDRASSLLVGEVP